MKVTGEALLPGSLCSAATSIIVAPDALEDLLILESSTESSPEVQARDFLWGD